MPRIRRVLTIFRCFLPAPIRPAAAPPPVAPHPPHQDRLPGAGCARRHTSSRTASAVGRRSPAGTWETRSPPADSDTSAAEIVSSACSGPAGRTTSPPAPAGHTTPPSPAGRSTAGAALQRPHQLTQPRLILRARGPRPAEIHPPPARQEHRRLRSASSAGSAAAAPGPAPPAAAAPHTPPAPTAATAHPGSPPAPRSPNPGWPSSSRPVTRSPPTSSHSSRNSSNPARCRLPASTRTHGASPCPYDTKTSQPPTPHDQTLNLPPPPHHQPRNPARPATPNGPQNPLHAFHARPRIASSSAARRNRPTTDSTTYREPP